MSSTRDCSCAASPCARGSCSSSTERVSKVVVTTKNTIRHKTTSINGTRSICGLSSARKSRMRIGVGPSAARVQGVEQLCRLVLHLDDVAGDAPAEVAMEHQRRDRDDHAGGGAHQRLADAAGQLVHVADAVVEDAQEALDHA